MRQTVPMLHQEGRRSISHCTLRPPRRLADPAMPLPVTQGVHSSTRTMSQLERPHTIRP